MAKRLSGNSELKLGYKQDYLALNKTHISAAEVEFTADRQFVFSRSELEAEYKRAQEIHPGIKDDLSHLDMLALANMFSGWSLDGGLSPIRNAYCAGLSEAIRKLADRVGPDWAPPTPDPKPLLSFMAKSAQGEQPRKRKKFIVY